MKQQEFSFRGWEARPGTRPINVSNDYEMVSEGLRAPLRRFDTSVHIKTESERMLLKSLKKDCNKPMGYKCNPREEKKNFVLYLKNNITDMTKKKFFKTTRTFNITETEMKIVVDSYKEKGYIVNRLDVR